MPRYVFWCDGCNDEVHRVLPRKKLRYKSYCCAAMSTVDLRYLRTERHSRRKPEGPNDK